MKQIWLKGQGGHLFVRDLTTSRIGVGVELALHGQSRLGRGCSNQFEDHSITDQRLRPPVLADPSKQTMFNFVPFAGSRWKMADADGEANLIGQLLQFPFPQTHAQSIASASISGEK